MHRSRWQFAGWRLLLVLLATLSTLGCEFAVNSVAEIHDSIRNSKREAEERAYYVDHLRPELAEAAARIWLVGAGELQPLGSSDASVKKEPGWEIRPNSRGGWRTEADRSRDSYEVEGDLLVGGNPQSYSGRAEFECVRGTDGRWTLTSVVLGPTSFSIDPPVPVPDVAPKKKWANGQKPVLTAADAVRALRVWAAHRRYLEPGIMKAPGGQIEVAKVKVVKLDPLTLYKPSAVLVSGRIIDLSYRGVRDTRYRRDDPEWLMRAADGMQSYSGAFEAMFLGADDGAWRLDWVQLDELSFKATVRMTIWATWESHPATPIAVTVGEPASPTEAR